MAKLKFYLRDKKAIDESMIQLVLHYDTNRLKISSGCKVAPQYWNEKKQRAKVLLEYPEGLLINDELDIMEEVMSSLLRKYRDLGYYPNKETLKKEFLALDGNPIKDKFAKTFWDHYEEFIDYKRKHLTDVRDYHNSLRKHLLNVEKKIGSKLRFSILADPQSDFADEWMDYLKFEALNSEGNPGLTINTVGKQNKNLKVFLNWCFDRNVVARFSLKKFKAISENVDKIYVTEEEIEKIVALKDLNESMRIVRDLFVIGCETGLRFSDFSRIDSDEIRDNQIHFRPKKTQRYGNNKIIIPISERLDSVLKNYNYDPPTFNGNQVTAFNKILREVCKEAGLDSEIVRFRVIGGKEVKEVRLKYEEISSHTCRRTFCTLKFLKGMPAQAIMKFSGHTTERNFLKYLKLDAELTASKYGEYF